LTFGDPVASIVLPKSLAGTQSLLAVRRVPGQQTTGNLAVYLQIVFVPRRRTATIICPDGTSPQSLSDYRISPDDIIVCDSQQSYEEDQDYTIDLANGRSNLVPRSSLAGKTLNVQVTEYFPAYQCSTNNTDWSPAVMFDPATPFVDATANYFPIQIKDGWFPVVDELGSFVGIQIQPKGKLEFEALLRIATAANPTYGLTRVLEIEFDRPAYYNGLRLTPFVDMPVHLLEIEAEGMLTNPANDTPIFKGDVLLDRPVSIRFADADGNPVFVRRLFLTLYQPNYSLTQQVTDPADDLRQSSLASLQTVLPISDRPIQITLPTIQTGALYEIGLRDIAAERYNPVRLVPPATGRGVFVSGPFNVNGVPEVIRLDADITGGVDCYLFCRRGGAGPEGDTQVFLSDTRDSQGKASGAMLPGTAISFKDVWAAQAGSTLTSADLYIKWVFRSDDAVLTRFLLQVTATGWAGAGTGFTGI